MRKLFLPLLSWWHGPQTTQALETSVLVQNKTLWTSLQLFVLLTFGMGFNESDSSLIKAGEESYLPLVYYLLLLIYHII